MENKQELWKKSTNWIFWGALAYSLLGIVAGIVGTVEALSAVGSMLSGRSSSAGVGTILSSIGVIAGYVFYFMGLIKFCGAVRTEDLPHAKKLKIAVILALVAVVVSMIPLMGWVAGVLNIVALILYIIAYSNLKKSETFPARAREGAKLLFVAAILSLVGVCLNFIPVAGSVLKLILDVVAMILLLAGWNKVRTSEAPVFTLSVGGVA